MVDTRFVTKYSTSSVTPVFPGAVMADRDFIPAYYDKTDDTARISVSEAITVPATGLVELLHNYGDPDESGAISIAGYTLVQKTTALGATEVWVKPGSNRLEFATSQSGNSVTVVYLAAYTSVSELMHARLYSELKATQQALWDAEGSFTANAGENLSDNLVYLASDGDVYIADPTDVQKLAIGWVAGAVSSGSSATIRGSGILDLDTELPWGAVGMLGRNGKMTWDADASANKLLSGDYIQHIARYRTSDTVHLVPALQAWGVKP